MAEKTGFVKMPGSRPDDRLNLLLEQAGLRVEVTVINCNAGVTFGRRALMDEAGPAEQLTEAEAIGLSPDVVELRVARRVRRRIAAATQHLRHSIDTTVDTLGIRRHAASGRPLLTGVGFSVAPHKIPAEQLVQLYQGAGFLNGENPHGECLAIVTSADQTVDVALLTPFADAPPVWGCYVGQRRDDSWFVISFTIMTTWHRISRSQGNLIRETVRRVEAEVERASGEFDVENMWVFVGPGASEGFEFKGSRSDKLDADEKEQYVHTELIPNPKVGEPGEPAEIEMPYLNLRGWVAGAFRDNDLTRDMYGNSNGGVPVDQVFELAHNTVTSTCYRTKRGLLGRGAVPAGTLIASNGFVGVIKPLGQNGAS